VSSPQEKEPQGTPDIFQIFASGVDYKKMISIYYLLALLLELLGFIHPGTLEWI
jgi:hypothetical protein